MANACDKCHKIVTFCEEFMHLRGEGLSKGYGGLEPVAMFPMYLCGKCYDLFREWLEEGRK